MNDNLKSMFGIGAVPNQGVFSEDLAAIIKESDYHELISRQKLSLEKKNTNISKKEKEEGKVVRVKKDVADLLDTIQKEIEKSGEKVNMSVIVDYFVLKGLEKL